MTPYMNHLDAALGQGQSVAREAMRLGLELAKIAGGTSTVAPAAADRRFADPAWSENPMYRRLAQVYLAWAAGVGRVADDLDTNGDDWQTAERARLAATQRWHAIADNARRISGRARPGGDAGLSHHARRAGGAVAVRA